MGRATLAVFALLWSVTATARGLVFTEELRGYVYIDGEFRSAQVQLHAVIHDIDKWSRDQRYPATLAGTLEVERQTSQTVAGTLQVLAPAPGEDGRLLTYRFHNDQLQFAGVKHVKDDVGPDLIDMVDDMTTVHGALAGRDESLPSVGGLLYRDRWTSELHFEWWDAKAVAAFLASFEAIDTPPGQEREVKRLFLRTVLGELAQTYYP